MKTIRGFSLLGTVLASTIVLLLLTTLAGMTQRSSHATRLTKDRVLATFLAREGIELVRAVRDGNWLGTPRCAAGTPCTLFWRGCAPGVSCTSSWLPPASGPQSLCNGSAFRLDASSVDLSGLTADTVGGATTALSLTANGHYVHDTDPSTPLSPFRRWVTLHSAVPSSPPSIGPASGDCGAPSVVLPTLFADDFTRAGGASLGPSWAEQAGNIDLNGTQAVSVGGVVNTATVNGLSLADVSVRSQYDLGSGSTLPNAGVVARYRGPGDTFMYAGMVYRSGGTLIASLWMNTGTWAELRRSTITPPSSGTLRLDVVGSTLSLYVNDTLSVTEPNNTAIVGAGLVGMRGGDTGQWFDDFHVSIPAPPAPAAFQPKPLVVTSVVQWEDRGVTKEVKLVEELYPWINTR